MRQEGAGLRNGQAAASRCREREPPCDQQAPATGTRGERGWFLLSSANIIASHGQTLMFKMTPVVCDYAKGYSGDEYGWLAGF